MGGFVLTEGVLERLVPIENATMKDRSVIEWDKDDIDELKMMKVDVLALGMLTAIKKCFDLVNPMRGTCIDLTIPDNDIPTYDMICKADTIGVFQIESRAQMSMLPRLQPRTYYDLVVEVAIVRPGPIQGGMEHPYLNNRLLYKKKHVATRLGIPTHYVLLKYISKEDDRINIIYVDGINRTLQQISPALLKKIVFGITWCTNK